LSEQARLTSECFHIGGKAGEFQFGRTGPRHNHHVDNDILAQARQNLMTANLSKPAFEPVPIVRSLRNLLADHEANPASGSPTFDRRFDRIDIHGTISSKPNVEHERSSAVRTTLRVHRLEVAVALQAGRTRKHGL